MNELYSNRMYILRSDSLSQQKILKIVSVVSIKKYIHLLSHCGTISVTAIAVYCEIGFLHINLIIIIIKPKNLESLTKYQQNN